MEPGDKPFDVEKELFIERYSNNIDIYGFTPQGMGWGPKNRQKERFANLIKPWKPFSIESILDVGSGLSDFFPFLQQEFSPSISYTGLEPVPKSYEYALATYSKDQAFKLFCLDVISYIDLLESQAKSIASTPTVFGVATFSGVFNRRYELIGNLEYIKTIVSRLLPFVSHGISINFLSADSADPQHIDKKLFYLSYSEALDLATSFGDRFIIDKSYLKYEFTLHIFKNLTDDLRQVYTN